MRTRPSLKHNGLQLADTGGDGLHETETETGKLSPGSGTRTPSCTEDPGRAVDRKQRSSVAGARAYRD
jgi:hypothetical protein